MATSLQPLFRPETVAVIGASRDECSMSAALVRNLADSFRGPLYLINPHTDRIGPLPSYGSIIDTPGPVDLAFIAVPAQHVLAAVRDCVAKPVQAIVVISAGFGEIGAGTEAQEHEILALVRAARIPLVGPNCLGVLSTDSAAPFNGTFGPSMLPTGEIAIATQSGALGFVLPELLRSQNQGVSQLVSLGNKLDLGENDFLQHWLTIPATRTILLYLESFQNPRELLDLGRRISQTRPLILLKAGCTAAGRRAAGSHTAALATPDRLADGLCRQADILRVETLEDMLNMASLVGTQPLPHGTRTAVLTNAGGLGVLLTDALEREGCEVPELSVALQEELRALVPRHASVRNPIDLVASVKPQLIGHCLECLLASAEVDAIVVLYVPRLPGTSPDIAQAIQEASGRSQREKMVLTVFAEREQNIVQLQRKLKCIPCFRYPESAARALAVAAKYAARQRVPELPDVEIDHARAPQARKIVDPYLAERGADFGWLTPAEAYRLLDNFHLPAPPWQIAHSEETVLQAAQQIGFPVVMKAIVPNLLHKSAVGGVVLDVRRAAEARDAWQALDKRISGLTGVLVQQYSPGGEEAIIGAKWEAGFGHVIGLGAGGTRVERLQQMEFRLLPLASRDAYTLIRDSAVADVCLAASGELTAAGVALYHALLRLSALVSALPEIDELDLNPVALLPAVGPLCVLDARMHVGRRSP